MVCWESNVTELAPMTDGPVTKKLLKVFAPAIVLTAVEEVDVKLTLLNVNPPLVIPVVPPVKLI
jgi:phospholipid N-methyltransferase